MAGQGARVPMEGDERETPHEDGEEHDGPRFSFMGLIRDLLAVFARKRKRREMKKKRSEKKKRVANTSQILQARRSTFIPLPPESKK